MKIYFEYGRNAISLPLIPQKLLMRAGKAELKLLLSLAADSSLAESYEERADELATEMKISRSALDSALAFSGCFPPGRWCPDRFCRSGSG